MKQKIRKIFAYHTSRIPHYRSSGFTLIELAIVLVVIGLLIGLGASMLGPFTKRAKLIESRETVKAAVEATIGYATTHKRIPTWGDYIPDGANDEFIEVVKNPNDAWTKPLYYFFETLLITNNSICNRSSTNLTICRNDACTDRIPNIAFIVVSSSENYNPQTGLVTPNCPSGQICVRIFDMDTPNIDFCIIPANCPNYPSGWDRINRAEPYDDIVQWVTLDELRTKIGCEGPPLKILNNELPIGKVGTAYNAIIFVDGGVPFTIGGKYRWCRQESASTGLTFNPNTLNANCATLAETSWGQADTLTISGTPTSAGSFNLIFFVRDNNDASGSNDNIAQKAFVLTIHPH